jgi:CubicO group peptidase (beta-lactamase class C family)
VDRPVARFQAGSIAKPVTALAALELAARGQADLDADVNDQLTSWHLPGHHAVSLRQLLGHTAGIGVPFLPGYPQGCAIPTLRQVLDGEPPSVTPPVRADPAKYNRFCYSGGGYAIIQQLISDLTGLPFAQAARCLILEPLGMTQSTFEQPLPDSLRPTAARHGWHVYPESAAAGLWTTPQDLARYACALQAAPTGRPSAVRTTTAARLLTPRTPLTCRGEWNSLPLLGIRPPDSFGLGMFLHGSDRFSHYGGAAGFFSALTASSKDGTGAVVMTTSNATPSIFRLLRAIRTSTAGPGSASHHGSACTASQESGNSPGPSAHPRSTAGPACPPEPNVTRPGGTGRTSHANGGSRSKHPGRAPIAPRSWSYGTRGVAEQIRRPRPPGGRVDCASFMIADDPYRFPRGDRP